MDIECKIMWKNAVLAGLKLTFVQETEENHEDSSSVPSLRSDNLFQESLSMASLLTTPWNQSVHRPVHMSYSLCPNASYS
jgi:hypothetical protein